MGARSEAGVRQVGQACDSKVAAARKEMEGASSKLRADFEGKAKETDARLSAMSKQLEEEVVAKLTRLDTEVSNKLKPLESAVQKSSTDLSLLRMDFEPVPAAINELSTAQDDLSTQVEAMGEKVDQAVSSIEIDGALLSMAEAASPR